MHPWLNPRVKTHGVRWWHINLTVVIAIVAVVLAFGLGLFAGSTIARNTAYYRAHYQAPLTVPHVYQRVHVSKRIRAEATDAGSIHFGYFASQTDDQGSLGACEAWAFTKSLSYAANWNVQPNGGHWHRFYAPRYLYDAVSSCQDAGSYLEQYPPAVTLLGVPQWTQMPYGPAAGLLPNPLSDFAVDCPTPAWAQTLARLHHLGVTETQLFPNQGSGPGGLALIHQQLATHHMVAVDLPVFPEYDRANADGSTVTLPLAGETDRGGHANDDVRSDPSHNNGDGTQGADLLSNQWSLWAGTGKDGIRHTGPHNGFVWVSWSFIEQYVWDAAVIHVPANSPGAKPPPPAAVDPHAPIHQAPAGSGKPQPGARAPKPKSAGWYVHNVRLTTGQDIAPLLNYWGDRYRVWPVGLAATVGVESGMNPNAERWKGGLDNSCGLLQQIITNVAYYTGIQGARAECNWELVPSNSIYLGARIYAEYFAYQHNCVQWPQAYGMYNAGAGYPCSYYYNPAGDVAAHLQVFYGWYSYALSHWAGGQPPPPPPPPKPRPTFPHSKWCHWTARHHRACPSPRWHGHLGTVPRQWWLNKKAFGKNAHPMSVCRGVLKGEQWNARRRVMKTSFAGCTVFSWPEFRGDPTLWYRGRR